LSQAAAAADFGQPNTDLRIDVFTHSGNPTFGANGDFFDKELRDFNQAYVGSGSRAARGGSHPWLSLSALRYLRLTYTRYIARQKDEIRPGMSIDRLRGAEKLAMKDDRRRSRKPRAILLPDTNPRRFVATRRPRLSKLTDYPELDFAGYERRLASLQGVLQLIQQAYLGSSERALIVLEGWDTDGKGGIVRRLGRALDPRSFKVHPISAPDQQERAEHYLQRFWRHLPQNGQIVAFDRSWYGRVLVERVEGLATEAEWRRAYREINEFERVLTDSGVRLVKLFLHITSKEQARRFRDRLINRLKRWKLSYEDFRNRTRRADYVVAIEHWRRHPQNLHRGT
jgi:polyphosphate kinase 2 (PPK2 family)